MAMHFRCGLHEGAQLTDDEIRTVLVRMGVRYVTERMGGAILDVSALDEGLKREPTDTGVIDLVLALFDGPSSGVSYHAASRAELCVLVPGATSPDFRTARSIAGVPGWYFKDLDIAAAELDDAHVQKILRRASALDIAVVFGQRELPRSAFGDVE